MSSPLIIAAIRRRGASRVNKSDMMSRNASTRSPGLLSAVCAMVLWSTRAATG
ncbi:Uncharacterised protein [Mycobacteroides abscessus subsp. abscessus]|nr:Uncharacterised protein [Mycobacteroides abscessus subsp. abscessus]